MLLLDINVLVYAMREDDHRHETCVTWLRGALDGAETVGIPELAIAGLLRITTNHRIFVQPSRPSDVFDFVHDVLDAPAAMRVRPADRHLSVFERIVRDGNFKGPDVTDAYFAAMALESGATFVTHDRGFARFPDIRLLDPLA